MNKLTLLLMHVISGLRSETAILLWQGSNLSSHIVVINGILLKYLDHLAITLSASL